MIDWLNPSDDVVEARRIGFDEGYANGIETGEAEHLRMLENFEQLKNALNNKLGHCKRHNTFFDDEPCWQCVNETQKISEKENEIGKDFTDTYIQNCLATESIISNDPFDRILHAAFGLVTEAGEFLDSLKKHIYYHKPLDYENLDEELGDSFFYSAIYLSVRGKSFREIMEANTRKLKARYPEKFTSECALNRDLKAEMKAFRKEEK